MSFVLYNSVVDGAKYIHHDVMHFPLRCASKHEEISSHVSALCKRMGAKRPTVAFEKPRSAWSSFGRQIAIDPHIPKEAHPFLLMRVITNIERRDAAWTLILTLASSIAIVVLTLPYVGFFIADLYGYAVGTVVSIAYTHFARLRADKTAIKHATKEELQGALRHYTHERSEILRGRNGPDMDPLTRIVYLAQFNRKGNARFRFSEPPLSGRIARIKKALEHC